MARNRPNKQQAILLKTNHKTSKINDLKNHIDKSQAKRNKDRYIQKIARNLFYTLHIATDDSLVLLIGTGAEKTNLEALITWVRLNFDDIESYPPPKQLSILISNLRDQLHNFDYS